MGWNIVCYKLGHFSTIAIPSLPSRNIWSIHFAKYVYEEDNDEKNEWSWSNRNIRLNVFDV
jgi:hypothetical protein